MIPRRDLETYHLGVLRRSRAPSVSKSVGRACAPPWQVSWQLLEELTGGLQHDRDAVVGRVSAGSFDLCSRGVCDARCLTLCWSESDRGVLIVSGTPAAAVPC